MKSVPIIILTVVLTAFCLSCSKSHKNKERFLTGRIIDSSNNLPISNTAFVLFTYDKAGSNHGDTYEQFGFTTDSNGHFLAVYNLKNGGNTLEIQYPADEPTWMGGYRSVWRGDLAGNTMMDIGAIFTYKQ